MGMQHSAASRTKKFEKQRKTISFVFVILLIAQIVLFYALTSTVTLITSDRSALDKIEGGLSQTFISDTIRNQLRITLVSARQGWEQYIEEHPDTELLATSNGKYVFSNSDGNSVAFDSTTMTKEKVNDDYYNIYDSDGNLILANARPTWNKEVVTDILNIIAVPLKGYGPSGTPTIYDSYTGEIIAGTGNNVKDYKTGCVNQSAYDEYVTNCLMVRRDSDSTSNYVDLSYESNILNQTDASNFGEYPLGQYNRLFVEKVILPYEAVSVDGQDMQITIALSASEQEIVNPYIGQYGGFCDTSTSVDNSTATIILYTIISVGISLVIILFSMFMIRVLTYQCKTCKNDDKESDAHS